MYSIESFGWRLRPFTLDYNVLVRQKELTEVSEKLALGRNEWN